MPLKQRNHRNHLRNNNYQFTASSYTNWPMSSPTKTQIIWDTSRTKKKKKKFDEFAAKIYRYSAYWMIICFKVGSVSLVTYKFRPVIYIYIYIYRLYIYIYIDYRDIYTPLPPWGWVLWWRSNRVAISVYCKSLRRWIEVSATVERMYLNNSNCDS